MELERVKGNTWVLKSWELIPLYQVDDTRCILLDTGTVDQRAELEAALDQAGLTPVAILGSHAHIDHMGSYGYFQKTRGAVLALTLGEAGQLFSPLGLQLQYYNLSLGAFGQYPELESAPCLPDRIILPQEREVTLCGVTFGLVRTPGHTVDHICVRTPDNVLYVGDAMMTGRVLHRAKFPYAFSMKVYLESLAKLRQESADRFIVAGYIIIPPREPVNAFSEFFNLPPQELSFSLLSSSILPNPHVLFSFLCARSVPVMQKILSLLRRCVEDYDMIAPGERVAVGVSGGKDSLVLLAALARLAQFYPGGFSVEAFTVDMGTPGMDLSPLADYCRELGVPFHRIPTQMYHVIFETRREKNPCALCAKMRRGSLHTALLEAGIHKVALGHHYDDAVETFFLSLFYESRLSCFHPVTYLDRTDITQIRPLLYVSEAMIREAVPRLQLPVVHNPCPADGHTKRQEVKTLIASLEPQYPKLKESVFAAMQRLPLPHWAPRELRRRPPTE